MSPTSNQIESIASDLGIPPSDALEFFLERAAIRQYEGGQTRQQAEAGAIEDLRQWRQQ